MNEKTFQAIARIGSVLVLVCVIGCGYLVMRHWELHRARQKAENQLGAVSQVARQQQMYQVLLQEFAMRMGKDEKIKEIMQRNLGSPTPAPTPTNTPEPTKEPGVTP